MITQFVWLFTNHVISCQIYGLVCRVKYRNRTDLRIVGLVSCLYTLLFASLLVLWTWKENVRSKYRVGRKSTYRNKKYNFKAYCNNLRLKNYSIYTGGLITEGVGVGFDYILIFLYIIYTLSGYSHATYDKLCY